LELDVNKLTASPLVEKRGNGNNWRFRISTPAKGDMSYAAKLYYEIASAFQKLIPNEKNIVIRSVTVNYSPQVFARFLKQLQVYEKLITSSHHNCSNWEKYILNGISKGSTEKYPNSRPILAWHGTKPNNIDSILDNGFLLSKVGSGSGDPGYFGKGLYFTQMASYGEFYINCRKQRSDKEGLALLLSWVLIGNPFPITSLSHYGKGCVDGYTSHYCWVDQSFAPCAEFTSPFGDEIVIFNENAAYPFGCVEYDKIQDV